MFNVTFNLLLSIIVGLIIFMSSYLQGYSDVVLLFAFSLFWSFISFVIYTIIDVKLNKGGN